MAGAVASHKVLLDNQKACSATDNGCSEGIDGYLFVGFL